MIGQVQLLCFRRRFVGFGLVVGLVRYNCSFHSGFGETRLETLTLRFVLSCLSVFIVFLKNNGDVWKQHVQNVKAYQLSSSDVHVGRRSIQPIAIGVAQTYLHSSSGASCESFDVYGCV